MASRIEHVIRCLEEVHSRLVSLEYDQHGIKGHAQVLRLIDEAHGHAVAAADDAGTAVAISAATLAACAAIRDSQD